MNVTMNGQTGHPHGMQITALIRGKTRNYFVYAESGKVRWRGERRGGEGEERSCLRE